MNNMYNKPIIVFAYDQIRTEDIKKRTYSAACKLCRKFGSNTRKKFTGISFSNLKNHLSKIHKTDFAQFSAIEAKGRVTVTKSSNKKQNATRKTKDSTLNLQPGKGKITK